uniref:Ornithine decarboxylase antizyme n=2 Tax=cellular organisms TaxID=131567 RepID=A0A0K2S3N3_BOMMO|nr:ornithine decarboxylase antizyme [Bombyx mori]
MGPWGPEAKKFLTEISKRLKEVTHDAKAGWYFAQRVSLAVQRGNVASILGTVPPLSALEDLFYCVGGPDVPAHGSAPPGGVTGGAASPATPATPNHDDNRKHIPSHHVISGNQGDLLSALLWSSSSSLASSAESLHDGQASPQQLQLQQQVVNKILERKDKHPVKIEFKIYLTENTVIRWEAVVHNNMMYLRVPGVLQSGSKDSFMLLLDFAEERLGCKSCIICVLKSRPDRATLLRTFMFMGFQVLAPNSPLTPQHINNPNYIFLHYNMQ